MTEVLFHVEITTRSVFLACMLNGFPLHEVQDSGYVYQNYPVNHLLVAGENKLAVTVVPDPGAGGGIAPADRVAIRVMQYAEGEVAGGDGGELIAEFGWDDLAALPDSTLTFTLDGPDFRARFEEAPVIEDEDAVRQYGFELATMMVARDVPGLVAAFAPKHRDFETAYNEASGISDSEFTEFLSSQFFPSEPVPVVDANLLGVRSCCGGRIWEVFVLPKKPLLTTTGTDAVSPFELPVFVGEVDGELKVVR